MVERGLAENSVKSYRRDLRRYLGYLDSVGVTELDQITEQTVSGFLMALREGNGAHQPLSATSAGRSVVAVRGFHKFAVREGLTPVDPSSAVRPPAPAKRLPKALPLADIERILAAAGAPGTALAMRDRALLEVLYGTGARISEAVGLDLDDLPSVAAQCVDVGLPLLSGEVDVHGAAVEVGDDALGQSRAGPADERGRRHHGIRAAHGAGQREW